MATKISPWDFSIIKSALRAAFLKLAPRCQARNPVMFTVYIGALLTSGLFIQAVIDIGEAPAHFILEITIGLWFTLLFANFAEAMAEGRGKAQAQALRKSRQEIQAKKMSKPKLGAKITVIPAAITDW